MSAGLVVLQTHAFSRGSPTSQQPGERVPAFWTWLGSTALSCRSCTRALQPRAAAPAQARAVSCPADSKLAGSYATVKLQDQSTFCDCLSFTRRMAVSRALDLLAFARVSTSPIITLRCKQVSDSSSSLVLLHYLRNTCSIGWRYSWTPSQGRRVCPALAACWWLPQSARPAS